MKRREAVGVMVGLVAGVGPAPLSGRGAASDAPRSRDDRRLAGRLKQSVSYWPYSKIPLAEFAPAAKQLGLVAIDLLYIEQWQVVKEAGLVPSMGYPTARRDFLTRGFNDPANHDLLVEELTRTLPLAASAGVPNLIAMFGNRNGRSDEEGAANCITGLKRVASAAEKHGVTICVELLNSKVDHKDYMGDHTAFGVKVMEGVGSPRVKLLYDIYHMQIMEGDVIRTIRDHLAQIGHFHTGGVPGRHEIDGGQELNYGAVCRAIVEAGFQGYLAHEFVPSRDPLTSLGEAVKLCEV
ncbi:MAG TPA: TIM barrel protein [Gemmatimonadales bacterium]|jgi:hydroxypyruvate isomerase|nr:TIM barrel protein [Gemmatimonadales bacterium]